MESFPVEEPTVDTGDDETQMDQLAKFIDKKSKPAQTLALILHSVHTEEHQEDLSKLGAAADPHQALTDMMSSKSQDGLAKLLKDWEKALVVQTHVVGADDATPAPSLRYLARKMSEEGGNETGNNDAAKQERKDVWNKAQAQRRKLCQFFVFKDEKQADVAYKSSILSKLFKPEVNQSHCLICFSCDLAYETEAQPWTQTSTIPKTDKTLIAR